MQTYRKVDSERCHPIALRRRNRWDQEDYCSRIFHTRRLSRPKGRKCCFTYSFLEFCEILVGCQEYAPLLFYLFVSNNPLNIKHLTPPILQYLNSAHQPTMYGRAAPDCDFYYPTEYHNIRFIITLINHPFSVLPKILALVRNCQSCTVETVIGYYTEIYVELPQTMSETSHIRNSVCTKFITMARCDL